MFNDSDEEHIYFRHHGGKREVLKAEILQWRDRNARRRMAAFRICRFLRDTTCNCNPVYAACRRRLEKESIRLATCRPAEARVRYQLVKNDTDRIVDILAISMRAKVLLIYCYCTGCAQ